MVRLAIVGGCLAVAIAACGEYDRETAGSESETERVEAILPDPIDPIVTPFGAADRSCVHQVPDGATVTAAGDVIMNGQTVFRHEPCRFRMPKRTKKAGTGITTLPTTNGWVVASNVWASEVLNTSFNKLEATWTVPPLPPRLHGFSANNSTQFYYPSLVSDIGILQPVLQYGSNGGFGSATSWVLSSWYVVDAEHLYHSPVITVAPGDVINGVIVQVSGPPVIQFNVNARDVTKGVSTGLAPTVSLAPNSAQGGVLESYKVDACWKYPGGGTATSVVFSNIKLYAPGPGGWSDFQQVRPRWQSVFDNQTPYCNYAVGFTDSTTTLTF